MFLATKIHGNYILFFGLGTVIRRSLNFSLPCTTYGIVVEKIWAEIESYGLDHQLQDSINHHSLILGHFHD